LRTCYANLGFIHYSLGQFEEAGANCSMALEVLPSNGEHRRATLETLARIRLAQGSLDDCESLLAEMESRITTREDWHLYTQRHATLTRAQLSKRRGLNSRALKQVAFALQLAERAHDHYLSRAALIEKSHILLRMKRLSESMEVLHSVMSITPDDSPELYARYETVLSCALLSIGDRKAALRHRDRAERIFSALQNQPGLLELSHSWSETERAAQLSSSDSLSTIDSSQHPPDAIETLQSIAVILSHAARPELVATDLIGLLGATDCISCGIATSGKPDELQIVASHGDSAGRTPKSFSKHLSIGQAHERSVDIWIEPKSDVESTATVNAVSLLLSTIHELERGRAEREQRLTLWPPDDVPLMNDRAVVNGKIAQMMTNARRVATTKISVLLTGESGTGKEILAKAIHTFSDRAERPFVPFNCAALPRDMLESQLFGHRRGAFTGADRDNPGLIRSASGGTLFLDEIGELSIDLQPKLLRFLESNEICPLGETTPFTVDVRIVAATNARLEQAVKDGRFREDLFYRLNGVRLEIPPLRERRDELPSLVHHFLGRAAIEFKKGHVRIAEETMERLLLAPWPGNIRQLQNELRRMVALAEPDAILTPASLSPEIAGVGDEPSAPRDAAPLPANAKLNSTLERIEREMVRAALHQHRGRMDDARKRSEFHEKACTSSVSVSDSDATRVSPDAPADALTGARPARAILNRIILTNQK
jgi:DNA-binding NtrC family response regulator